MHKSMREQLQSKYDFSSEGLDIIIKGQSSLDSRAAFRATSLAEADLLLASYGYHSENPIEIAEILGVFHESVNFIRKYFLQPDNPQGLRLEVPRKILELKDVRLLCLMASQSLSAQGAESSGPAEEVLRNWACSILKVMHTLTHIDKDLRSSYFSDIQKQIFDRFYKLIQRNDQGQLFLSDRASSLTALTSSAGGGREDYFHQIPLVAFETKPKKHRDSIILKLLHKPENVAEDIFDRVGIRFVTPTPLDSLRVIKYLQEKMVLIPPHIKPSRSRNTLIDLDHLRQQIAGYFHDSSSVGDHDEQGRVMPQSPALLHLESRFLQQLRPQTPQTPPGNENRHSSQSYRAIQFTCRQLIKLENSLYSDLRELKSQAKESAVPSALSKTIDRIDLRYVQREIRFFYPFEIQLVDSQSAEANEKGESAHSSYKKAQIQTALNRIMRPFVS